MSGSDVAVDQARDPQRDPGSDASAPVARRGEGGPSDTRLMEAIAAGDTAALQTLMDRHWPGIVRYGRRMRLSYDEAMDVAQEVFVRVWEHRHRWASGGSARGYLYRIARGLVLDGVRRDEVRQRSKGQLRNRTARVATPLETTARHELEEAIEDAIDALPERRREAFTLVRIEGLGLRAASEVLGVARQTVANHVHLAVKDLQKALGPFLA